MMTLYNLILGSSARSPIKGHIWCSDGKFRSSSEFPSSRKNAYGYALTDKVAVSLRRSYGMYSWESAKYYCEDQVLGYHHGYMPSIDELESLYHQIMTGEMRDNLKIAGVFQLCNYRDPSTSALSGWQWMWSSTELDKDSAEILGYEFFSNPSDKNSLGTVIPFYQFDY